jgi:hypothetical protein
MKYINPIFKFSKKEHRDTLCKKGEIRIGTLFDFKSIEKHKGRILDLGEGTKTVNVFFDKISLPANELNKYGLPFSGTGIVNLPNSTISLNYEEKDCFVYCSSSAFFSDSLKQAIEDEYDACTLIIDPENFYKEIDENFDEGKLITISPCIYEDRTISVKWAEHKDSIKTILDIPAVLIKPKEYSNQREVRGVLNPNTENIIEPLIKTYRNLTKYTIPISFNDLDYNALSTDNQQRIGVRVIKSNTTGNSEFSIRMPNEVFTPLIFGEEDNLMIGFLPQTHENSYVNPVVKNAEIGITTTDYGPLFCVNKLKDILSLEYYSE